MNEQEEIERKLTKKEKPVGRIRPLSAPRPTPTPEDLMPRFYDPAEDRAQLAEIQGKEPEKKYSNLPLDQYFLQWHERLKRECDEMRTLVEMWVTMHRRYRAVTLTDAWGYFGTQPETRGRWIEYDPDEDGDIHPINIVRADIRANVATLLQISLTVTVASANKNAKHSENANRIQRMIDFFEREEWNEADRNLIFDGIHKEGMWLLENFIETCGWQKINAPAPAQTFYAVYRCAGCKSTGKKEVPAEVAVTQQQTGKIDCPACGDQADGMIKSFNRVEMQERELQTFDIKHRTWSAFNILIDRQGARKKGIETTRYLRIHECASRAELETDYPQHEFAAPFEFCYPLRCQQALASGDWSNLYSSWTPGLTDTIFDDFEKLTYFLHEESYSNYVAPSDFSWKGKDGKVKFEIKRGETIAAAQKRLWGENHKGLAFIIVNDALVDIVTPKEDEINLREKFTDVHFNRDSASFLSVPHWDSKQLMDDITNLNSIKAESAAENAKKPVWFNSAVFDIDDFGEYYIPSKDEFTDENFDINKAIAAIPQATTTDELTETLEWLLGVVRPQVSSVTPALRGEAQPNQPYAAQRQQLEQSFGILSSASKSYAQLYLKSMKQKTRLAFKTWTLEQFQRVAAANGEEWTESMVAELTKTDLERDVVFAYATGSEQPQGQLQKELKFYNALAQLMPFIQGGVIKPEVLQQIMKKIDEFGGFDFDLSGLETSDALAQARYERFAIAAKPYEGTSNQKLEMLKSQIVSIEQQMQTVAGVDGAPRDTPVEVPITAFDTMLEQLISQTNLVVSEFEDFAAQKLFFVARILEELAKTKPNYVLIEVMNFYVKNIEQMALAKQQEAIQNDPALIEERRRAEESRAAQSAAENQRAAAENESREQLREAQTQDADRQLQENVVNQAVAAAGEEDTRNFERERMDFEAQEAEKQRAHEREMAEKAANDKKQEK